ncbi:MAG: aminopeptidase [Dysosmobacter sp.]
MAASLLQRAMPGKGAAYLAISASGPREPQAAWTPAGSSGLSRLPAKALKDFDRLQMCGGFPWCIASGAHPQLGEDRVPRVCGERGHGKLWDAIFPPVRIQRRRHRAWTNGVSIWPPWTRRVEKLNALNFKSLHYTNSLGTDLTVELPEDHRLGSRQRRDHSPARSMWPICPRRRSSPLL